MDTKLKSDTMKKVLFGGLLIVLAGLGYAFSVVPVPAPEVTSDTAVALKWYSWEEAVEANKKAPKKLFIDVYTDWCGWCKKMDKSTFVDPEVAAYLGENFYPVKFNAEQKEAIEFDGTTFEFVEAGRRGVHELAYALLDGRLGYPAFVYLDEEMRRITISPGYKTADVILKELRYIGGDHYKDQTFEEFSKNSK